MTLEPQPEAPMRRVSGEELGRGGRLALVREEAEWPGGLRTEYVFLRTPDAAFVVPVDEAGRTLLVRQWRYPWAESSWEVPAGTLEEGEEPLPCARRELVEEAGLEAAEWLSLGAGHGSAALTGRQHLFLARGLRQVPRAPEDYERDMVVRELPLREAVDEALAGAITHSASIAALLRAARATGLI